MLEYGRCAVSTQEYTIDEVCDRGEQIYEEQIKHLVEPQENGKFIVIDIESGDYEIDEDEIAADERLYERRPDAVGYLGRIGCKAAYRIGFGGARIENAD
jgi:hypothetical protein